MFCFIGEQIMLHKILKVLLKECWELHKGCLGAACGSYSCCWEPLVYIPYLFDCKPQLI